MRGCRPLTKEEVQATLYGFPNTEHGARGRAMFVTQLTTGVRISELLSLDLGNVVTRNGRYVQYLVFQRKNTKGQKAGQQKRLQPDIRGFLDDWVKVMRESWGFIHEDDPFFCTKAGKRLSRFRAYDVYRDAFARGGVQLEVPGTHTPRKTYADHTYDDLVRRTAEGEVLDPIRGISQLLGHANITNTEKYLRFRYEQSEKSVNAVTDLLFNPPQNGKT